MSIDMDRESIRQLVLSSAARAATKFSELVVCRALLAISYRLTAQNVSAKCEEVTDKDSIVSDVAAKRYIFYVLRSSTSSRVKKVMVVR